MTNTPRFGAREWQLAYSVAMRVLKAPHLAEDAAQDAMMRAYRARHGFTGAGRFESWLYRVAFTTALSYLRSTGHRLDRGAIANDAEHVATRVPAAHEQRPDVLAEVSELAARLERSMAELNELDRLAFTERYLRGTTERELGQILGVSTNAAKQRAFRARRAIRAAMREAGIGPAAKTAVGA